MVEYKTRQQLINFRGYLALSSVCNGAELSWQVGAEVEINLASLNLPDTDQEFHKKTAVHSLPDHSHNPDTLLH